jgi:hypothetical protein
LEALRAPSGVDRQEAEVKAGSAFPRIMNGSLCLEGQGSTCSRWYDRQGPIQ